jgi:hypothetical protein
MVVICWLLGIEINAGGAKQKKPHPNGRGFSMYETSV